MRKARLNKPHSLVGPKRLSRLLQAAESRKQLLDKIRAAQGRARRIKRLDPVGLKRHFVPGMEKEKIRTPYMRIEIARRRAANKVSRRSRKANR